MTASVVKKPFDNPDWIFETKLDGFRSIAVIDSAGKSRLCSRNRLPLEQKFPTIRDAVEGLNLRSNAALLALGDRDVFTGPDYPEWRNQHN
jgi:bifunctional non-homologous end joining protein LigD